jgi:transcriptional regulator with XRE-family HTH domain
MGKSMATKTPHLRAWRERQGLSLRETARAAGIDPSHLSKVERGQVSLSVEKLARLAAVLELDELAKPLALYHMRGGDASENDGRRAGKPVTKT